MSLVIRSKSLEVSERCRGYVERRVQFELARFSARIGRVTVYLADVNGPRKGIDKHCRVVVRLLRAGRIVVEDTDAGLETVVDRAMHRVAASVRRELERRRGSDIGRLSPKVPSPEEGT